MAERHYCEVAQREDPPQWPDSLGELTAWYVDGNFVVYIEERPIKIFFCPFCGENLARLNERSS